MKSFITKNWEKILICIGCIILVVMLVSKVTAEKTLIEDYAKYGKDIVAEKDVDKENTIISGDLILNTSGDVVGKLQSTGFYQKLTNTNPELFKLGMMILAGILAVVILTSIPNLFAGKKDTKKK